MREEGLLTLSDSEWEKARRRADIIRPLAKNESVSRIAADEAAKQLGVSRRHFYELLRRYKSGTGLVTDLAVQRSTGGKGKSRICAEAEKIIDEVIRKFYMSKQRFSEAVVVREISKRCKQASIAVPSRNTIRRRVDGISSLAIAAKRFGHEETRSLKPVLGSTPKPMKPLEFVQMDHTKVDLIIVEQQSREPIGRPFLTLAIDVFSRCIVGMLLTLEAPSATSVGLCLAHCVIDKKPWLETLGLPEVSWPVRGKPGTICSDNGPEFKSEALIRGCQQHGITLEYRPLGEPQYGGIIERVIPSVSMMFETSSGFSLV